MPANSAIGAMPSGRLHRYTANAIITSAKAEIMRSALFVYYVWYSEEGTGRGRSPPSPLLAVPNVTAHPSTASVPISILLYNGPLFCCF